jgi:hypothetical protein
MADAVNADDEKADATPRKVAEALTALAIDLEHTDLPPTTSQRELLAYEKARLDSAEKNLR